jgi:hypothetical protein
MKINPNFISPCGLYCGVCAIYIAHRDDNHKFKERLVNLYKGEVAGKGTLIIIWWLFQRPKSAIRPQHFTCLK